jgi:tetratricopeptide (TPR) repeat protein
VTVVIEQDGKFQFVSAESIQVNGKDRLRLCAAAPSYDPKRANSCETQRLAQLPLVRRDYSRNELIVPSSANAPAALPDNFKTEGSSNDLWTQSTVQLSPAGKKQAEPLPPGQIHAILQSSDSEEAIRNFLSDETNFASPKGIEQTLSLQGRLITAALTQFPQSTKIRALRDNSFARLKAAIDELQNGLVEAPALEETRRRVQTSAAVFPNDPEFKKERDRFQSLEQEIQKRRYILRALAAGSQWDAYLKLYSQMQRYEFLYPELAPAQRKALEMSRDQHKLLARARLDVKDCAQALAHLRIALKRDPNDDAAQQLAESTRVCLVRAPRAARTATKLGSEFDNAPALRIAEFVDRFAAEGKLESAERELRGGLNTYPDFPPLLLSQVRLLEKRGKFREALAVLDRYDSLVSEEAEWAKGDRARREMEFQIVKGRDERAVKMTALLKENRFESALELVKEGLHSDPEDHDLLFRAGVLSLFLRQRADAKNYLLKYLEASQSLAGSPERRKQAFQMIGRLDAAPNTPTASETAAHWFSHAPLPPNAFYDPTSLQFSRRVDRIVTNQKQWTEYRWSAQHLDLIQSFADEKPPRLLSRYRFEYNPATNAVSRIFDATAEPRAGTATQGEERRAATIFDDPVAASPSKAAPEAAKRIVDTVSTLSGPGYPVLLANNPNLDLPLVEELTGSKLGVVVAGNKYFHPFVWDRPHLFRVSYDASGRIKRAFAAGTESKPTEIYDFIWQGSVLQSISLYAAGANGQPDTAKLLYRRTMTYSDGKLLSETITPAQGKPTVIEYKFQGSQMTVAECDEDPTLDNRSRKVTFLP